jgi:hypothetical protein
VLDEGPSNRAGHGGQRGEDDGAKIGHAVTNSVIHGQGMGSARRMRGFTVEECAARAGVTMRRWADWEAGRDWPTEIEVRQALGVSRETLMRLGAAEPGD